MIYFRGEGQPIRSGLNIYPQREWGSSRGFIGCLGSRRLHCRYSTALRCWCIHIT